MSRSLYTFDISNGKVTRAYEMDDGHAQLEHLSANERFEVAGANVLKIETHSSGQSITTFTDENHDGYYVKASESWVASQVASSADASQAAATTATDTPSAGSISSTSPSQPSLNVRNTQEKYSFSIASGQVTGAYELEHGVMKTKEIHANTSFAVTGSSVTQTETGHYGSEVTVYADPDGNGLYAKVSEQWVSSGSSVFTPAATPTDLAGHDDSTDGDDTLHLSSAQSASGGLGADQFVVHGAGSMAIGDFDQRQGDRLVFETGLGLRSVQDLLQHVTHASYDGRDFHVELDGGRYAVTLTGVSAESLSMQAVSVNS